MSFPIKQTDTSPILRYALIPADRTLAGAVVRFRLKIPGGPTVIDAPAEIVSDLPPVVQYVWQPGDTSRAGEYEGEFPVVYADGGRETYPNQGFIPVEISANIPPKQPVSVRR